MSYIHTKQEQILERARENYGSKNQITVAIEELCELATVLAKYPRYDRHDTAMDKIRQKVLEEYADVTVVLDHVKAIFQLGRVEIEAEIDGKLERLERWMDTSPSFEHTTVDRQVGKLCSKDCYGWEHFEECVTCGGNRNESK